MQDFDELKQIKAQCLADITEALPDYACQGTGTWHTSMPRVPVPRQLTIEKL